MSANPRRSDLIDSAIWVALGVVMLSLSWNMDRLERMHINPLSAPGLVPGLLGCCLILFGAVLGYRAYRGGASALSVDTSLRGAVVEDEAGRYRDSFDLNWAALGRLLIVAAICIFFATVVLGRGIPFFLSTAGFAFVLSIVVERLSGPFEPLAAVRRAAITAVLLSAFITVVFERIMLLRLP